MIKAAGRRGAAGLTEAQLHELTRLYPAVAVDVARARMYHLDPAMQRRINQLAIAAHGLLYRRKHIRPMQAVIRFFQYDYPRLFRRLWPCVAIAVVLFAWSTGAAQAEPPLAVLAFRKR